MAARNPETCMDVYIGIAYSTGKLHGSLTELVREHMSVTSLHLLSCACGEPTGSRNLQSVRVTRTGETTFYLIGVISLENPFLKQPFPMRGNKAHHGHPPLSELFQTLEKETGSQPNRAAVANSLRHLAERHKISITNQEIGKMVEVIIENPQQLTENHPSKTSPATGNGANMTIQIDLTASDSHPLAQKLTVFWRCYKRQIIWLILFYFFEIFLFGMGVYEYLYVKLPGSPMLHYSPASLTGLGFGMVLQVNCGVLLIGPALRWITGSLRKTWVANIVPFDSWIMFHIVVATTTWIAVVGHITAMVVSFYISSTDKMWIQFNITLTAVLTKSGIVGSDFLGYTAISGWVALGSLLVMTIFALPPLRRSVIYDLFYWTHKLQFVFWAALIIHTPDFWKYFIGPLVLYLVEKSRKYINAIRWSGTSHISDVKLLPSEVTNLVLKRPHGFHYTPGDYCFLKIPSLGLLSWHPFTISSSPDKTESIWFHIKSSGNYTRNIRKKFEKQLEAKDERAHTNVLIVDPNKDVTELRKSSSSNKKQGFLTNLHVPVFIDGPYGSSSNGLFHSEHAVLVCAGIGVTPFASVLSSLLSEFKRTNKVDCPNCDHQFPVISSADPLRINRRRLKLKKVDFVWVVRDLESIEWFHDLFYAWDMHQAAFHKTSSPFLKCHIYVTSNKQIQKNGEKTQWTIGNDSGTISIRPGRPNWPKVFDDLDQGRSGKIDVYYCGTHALEDQIRNLCGQHKFGFSWENF